jgi:hypothetical protein
MKPPETALRDRQMDPWAIDRRNRVFNWAITLQLPNTDNLFHGSYILAISRRQGYMNLSLCPPLLIVGSSVGM